MAVQAKSPPSFFKSRYDKENIALSYILQTHLTILHPRRIVAFQERPDKPGSDLLLSSCKLLKKIVYVNAPFCQPALVTGVSDESRVRLKTAL